MTEGGISPRWHVFVSYSRADAADVRLLAEALKAQHLRVFIDEQSVEVHESITGRINDGLANSAAMLVYYSQVYPTRSACQRELTAAFLSAQASGEIARRILVVNPEPGEDHIEPVELRDLRFQPAPRTKQERKALARQVAELVTRLPDGMGASISLLGQSRWWPSWPVPAPGVVGRYPMLWRLHSALRVGMFPLTGRAAPVRVAVVSGMPGIGKTTLAQQYALEFGGAYPAVVRVPHAGDDGDVLAAYHRSLRAIAGWAGLSARGIPGERLRLMLAERLTERGELCLWIVEDVPSGLPPETVRLLVIPSPSVHTILTTRDRGYADIGESLPLEGLAPDESLELLAGSYPREEEPEAAALASDLGGHPMMLRIAASALRHRRGLVSVAEYRRRAVSDPGGILADTLSDADEAAGSVLAIASVLAPAPVPSQLLARALATKHGWAYEHARDVLINAIEFLQQRCIAVRNREAVWIHPLAFRAVSRDGANAGAQAAAAAALAELLAPHTRNAELDPHVRHLAAAEGLADDAAIPLLGWLAETDACHGDHVSAGQLGEQLSARLRRRYGQSDSRTTRAISAAVRAYTEAGDYAAALSLAEQIAGDPDLPTRHALARALDGLGRFAEAAPHWDAVAGALPAMEQAEATACRMDWVRALRLRGRAEEAAAALEALGDSGPPQRYLEEALLAQIRGHPVLAKRAADRAVAAFREAGMEHHPACLEAIGLGVDMQLGGTIGLKPLPYSGQERKPLAELERLRGEYRSRYGEHSPFTLAVTVRYGELLANWGDTEAGRGILEEAEHAARVWLGEHHPQRLRALYGLSQAAAIQRDFQTAADLAGRAFEGQRLVLGERHPDTLVSLVHHGLMRYFLGDAAGADSVRRAAGELRKMYGPLNFEFGHASFAQAFTYLPAPAVRGLVSGALFMDNTAKRATDRMRNIFRRAGG